jgi:hypothetical protein
LSAAGLAAAMQRSSLAALGLWVFTAGILAWVFPNATQGAMANVVTDAAIVLGGALAAFGLPRAVEGIGTGPLRVGLAVVALFQLGQNLVTIATKLSPTNAAPAFVVLFASAAVLVGVKRWQEDGWDLAPLPWLAGGFAGFAFEPVYFFVLGAVQGSFYGPYSIGAWLVAIGAGLAAWCFRPQGLTAGVPTPPLLGRAA